MASGCVIRPVGARSSQLKIGGGADYLVTPRVCARLTVTAGVANDDARAGGTAKRVAWQISYPFD
jgi:hypothetical protein